MKKFKLFKAISDKISSPAQVQNDRRQNLGRNNHQRTGTEREKTAKLKVKARDQILSPKLPVVVEEKRQARESSQVPTMTRINSQTTVVKSELVEGRKDTKAIKVFTSKVLRRKLQILTRTSQEQRAKVQRRNSSNGR